MLFRRKGWKGKGGFTDGLGGGDEGDDSSLLRGLRRPMRRSITLVFSFFGGMMLLPL